MIEQYYNGQKYYISEEWKTPEWQEKARKVFIRHHAMFLLGLKPEDFEKEKTISNINELSNKKY